MFIKTIFDPQKGLYNKLVGTEAEAIVDLGSSNLSASFINGGTTNSVIPNISSLIDVVGTKQVWVESVRDFFTRMPSSTRTVDNIEVVATDTGAGRWERSNVPHPSWAVQTSIWINPLLGNDENDASVQTQGAGFIGPIKTFAEAIRRLGKQYQTIAGTTQTIWIDGDCPELPAWDVIMATGSSLVIQGVLTAQYTGALSAHSNYTVGSQLTEATATWTVASELKRLVIENSTGASAWVIKAVSSTNARLSRWAVQPTTITNQQSFSTTNVITGATVTTYTLSRLAGCYIRTSGSTNSNFIVKDLEIYSNSQNNAFIAMGGFCVLTRCLITGTYRASGGTNCFINCLIATSSSTIYGGNEMATRISWAHGALHNSQWAGGSASLEVIFQGDVVFQGSGGPMQIGTRGFYRIATNFCFADCTGNLLEVFEGGVLRISTGTTWSTGCTGGTTIKFRAGSRFVVSAGVVLSGLLNAASDAFTVDSQTSLYAWDDANHVYTATKRNLTWTNWAATFAGGGFERRINDPYTGFLAFLES